MDKATVAYAGPAVTEVEPNRVEPNRFPISILHMTARR